MKWNKHSTHALNTRLHGDMEPLTIHFSERIDRALKLLIVVIRSVVISSNQMNGIDENKCGLD